MRAHKISISLPDTQFQFLENYMSNHQIRTRSEVISAALQCLQQVYLEEMYRQANDEITTDFDIIASEGLDEDETW